MDGFLCNVVVEFPDKETTQSVLKFSWGEGNVWGEGNCFKVVFFWMRDQNLIYRWKYSYQNLKKLS